VKGGDRRAVSAAMEWSARLVAVLLLRHGGGVATRRIPLLAHFDSGPSSLIGRANVLVQSKEVARVEFGLELPQPFERLRIICGLNAIRALVTKEI
jgi:hypothetical protein